MVSKGELDRLKVTVIAEDSVLYESPYLGQHGVSFLLTSERGGVTKRILVDVAQNPSALLENMRMMDIEPTSIDAVVLTHCHYDHTQGLGKVLKEIGKTDIPVKVGDRIISTKLEVSDRQRKILLAGGILNLAK